MHLTDRSNPARVSNLGSMVQVWSEASPEMAPEVAPEEEGGR